MRRNHARRRRGDAMKNRPLPSPIPRHFRRDPPPPAPQESEDYLIPLEEPLTAFADYSYPYQHQLVAPSRSRQSPALLEVLQQDGLLGSSPRPTVTAPVHIPEQLAEPRGPLETVENWSPTQLQLQHPLLPLPSGTDAHAHSLRPTLQATQSPGATPLYEEISEGPSLQETTTLWVQWTIKTPKSCMEKPYSYFSKSMQTKIVLDFMCFVPNRRLRGLKQKLLHCQNF